MNKIREKCPYCDKHLLGKSFLRRHIHTIHKVDFQNANW